MNKPTSSRERLVQKLVDVGSNLLVFLAMFAANGILVLGWAYIQILVDICISVIELRLLDGAYSRLPYTLFRIFAACGTAIPVIGWFFLSYYSVRNWISKVKS